MIKAVLVRVFTFYKDSAVKNKTSKQAVVLCDNDLLFDVIKLNLQQIQVRPVRHKTGSPTHHLEEQSKAGDFDLIIVAISLPNGEPVVTLFEASLTKHIGQIPLLIISDRKFDSNLDDRIFHLTFPFDASDLRNTVQIALDHQIVVASS